MASDILRTKCASLCKNTPKTLLSSRTNLGGYRTKTTEFRRVKSARSLPSSTSVSHTPPPVCCCTTDVRLVSFSSMDVVCTTDVVVIAASAVASAAPLLHPDTVATVEGGGTREVASQGSPGPSVWVSLCAPLLKTILVVIVSFSWHTGIVCGAVDSNTGLHNIVCVRFLDAKMFSYLALRSGGFLRCKMARSVALN